MQSIFAMSFARVLSDALEAAGWLRPSPCLPRWTHPAAGLTVRLMTERRVAVRRTGRPGEVPVGSFHSDPTHAALHVARQLHALRVVAQAEREARAAEKGVPS